MVSRRSLRNGNSSSSISAAVRRVFDSERELAVAVIADICRIIRSDGAGVECG